MLKSLSTTLLLIVVSATTFCQDFDTTLFQVEVSTSPKMDSFFKRDAVWLGADGASSIDLGDGRILWLFSDGFIALDTTRSRKKSKIIRNSVALQKGYDLTTTSLTYYWKRSENQPQAFFHSSEKVWFWTGHGTMVRDHLLIFLMKVRKSDNGLGFEVFDWSAVLIVNPKDEPSQWKIRYLKTPATGQAIVGSAAVLVDENFLYAYSVSEPSHDVYLLRWKLENAYRGKLQEPEWWLVNSWQKRRESDTLQQPLFVGGTEFSVHYDSLLKKYVQIQSFGFGESSLGLRVSDSLQGPWSKPYVFYKPSYQDIKRPFMYSAKAHPELASNGVLITYNINSFDFSELINNGDIYFPRFVRVQIKRRQ